MEQGKLLGFMGILSACIQGGWVRRVVGKKYTEKSLILQGLFTCSLGLIGLSWVKQSVSVLYGSVALLAFTSGTVVNCLTSLASQCEGEKGRVLGGFRAIGQRGRALGPICACCLYWWVGSDLAYGISSVLVASVGVLFYNIV